jgi:hypothetical protein
MEADGYGCHVDGQVKAYDGAKWRPMGNKTESLVILLWSLPPPMGVCGPWARASARRKEGDRYWMTQPSLGCARWQPRFTSRWTSRSEAGILWASREGGGLGQLMRYNRWVGFQ